MSNSLSDREKEVLYLIAYENTAKQIASKLFISSHTVISHKQNLMTKLSAKNSAGLVRRGFELGLIS